MSSNAWCDLHWKPYAEKRENGIAAQAFLLRSITDDERYVFAEEKRRREARRFAPVLPS